MFIIAERKWKSDFYGGVRMTTEYYYEMYGIALKAYNAAVDNISSCNRNYADDEYRIGWSH